MTACLWQQTRWWEEAGWVTQCDREFTLIGKEDPDLYDLEYCPFCGLQIKIESEEV